MEQVLQKVVECKSLKELIELFKGMTFIELVEINNLVLRKAYILGMIDGNNDCRLWIKPEEHMPQDDELVVVKTKDGAKYFGRTISGRFMDNVVAWYPLPK